MLSEIKEGPAAGASPADERPDVFMSYAHEDSDFVENRLSRALLERGKNIWIDVEDIRGGASDWRAVVWRGIESAKVVVFVLTPDSLASSVCGEELQRAVDLNKRIVPVMRRPVDGLEIPPALERPNWIHVRADDDFEAGVSGLVAALELDEEWIDQHARFTQRTSEWLRHERDAAYLLRGSDLRAAEHWLDAQGAHREAPTPEQVAYITAGLRETARRQRLLLGGVGLALVVTTALAILAFIAQNRAEDRERTARAQARAAQAIAALSQDPEESLRRALEAVEIRSDEPEADYALRRSVGGAGWTSILRNGGARDAAALLDVEFADDGLRVASAADDGEVAVWDTRTGRRLALVKHEEAVHTVQLSPDGRRLLTASQDGTARTWDSSNGRLLRVFDTRSDDAWAATYSARGRVIATASAAGAHVWDAASGAQIARLPSKGGYRGTIRLSVDGRHALTPAGEGGDAWLWNVSPRRRVATLSGEGDPLTFALFSRDGRRILTVDVANRATVWATAGGRPIARFRPEGARVTDADISSDGRLVVTAGNNGLAQVWDVGSRRRIAQLGNGESLSSALFDRGGRHVVTGDDSGVARVWSVATGRPVSVLRGHTAAIRRARFSPDGTQVVTASGDGSARLWRALPQTPDDPRWQRADSTNFGPDSRHVLVVEGVRRAVWDVRSGSVVRLRGGIYAGDPAEWPCGHAGGCAPWSPDARLVAGADATGHAVVWDARTGAVVQRLGRGSRTVIGAAFSPDGRRIAVVDGEKLTATIWKLPTGQLETRAPVPGTGEVLRSAQFIADPLRVVTVDVTGLAQVSDLAAKSSTTLAGTTQPGAVAVSRDGRQVAIGTLDGELRVFSGGTRASRVRRTTEDAVNSVAFDPVGTAIATGGQKGITRVADARTLALTTLRAYGGAVKGATFSPDGRLVLVTSGSIARLWDRALQRVVLELPRTRDAGAELSPDASRIVISGDDRLEVRACYACMRQDALVRRARSLLPAP
jgi:WD40 repeat protein